MVYIKCLISFHLAFLSVAAMAAEVKITSFKYTGRDTYSSTAEICGIVNGGGNGPLILVDLVIDPRHRTPGKYTTVTAQDGQFCAVVSTLTGRAEASVRGESQKVNASIIGF